MLKAKDKNPHRLMDDLTGRFESSAQRKAFDRAVSSKDKRALHGILTRNLGYDVTDPNAIEVHTFSGSQNAGVESMIRLPDGSVVFKAIHPETKYIHVPKKLADDLNIQSGDWNKCARILRGLVDSIQSLGMAFLLKEKEKNEEELERLQSEILRLMRENEGLRGDLENLERENLGLRGELSNAEKALLIIQDFARRIDALEKDKVVQNQRMGVLEEENRKKDLELASVNERLGKVEKRQDTQERNIQASFEALQALNLKINEQALALERHKQEVASQFRAVDERLDAEKAERERVIREISAAKAEQVASSGQLSEAASRELLEKIRRMEEQLEQHNSKITFLDDERQKTSEKLDRQYREIQEKLNEQAQKIEENKRNLEESNKENLVARYKFQWS